MQSSCGARLEADVAAEMLELAQHTRQAAGLLGNMHSLRQIAAAPT